jgi:MFS family permease
MGLFGAVNYMPTFVQGVMGTSARDSGFVTSPMMMGMIAASTFSGIVATRTGKFRPLIITGSIAIAGGMFFLSTLNAHSTELQAAAAMIVIGLGIGTSMPIVNLMVQNSVPHHMLGVVSSSNQFFRQIGGTLGTAIFGTIVTTRLVDNLEKNLSADIVQATPPSLLDTLQEPRTLLNEESLLKLENGYAALGPAGDGFYEAALSAMRLSLADAISVVFFFGFVFTSIGLIVSLFMPEAGALRTSWSEETPERVKTGADSQLEGEPVG